MVKFTVCTPLYSGKKSKKIIVVKLFSNLLIGEFGSKLLFFSLKDKMCHKINGATSGTGATKYHIMILFL